MEDISPAGQYSALKVNLNKGWNTWNTRSVLSHVLLPHGLSLNLCLRSTSDGSYLKTALIGTESVRPAHHADDGSYTDLTITWQKYTFRIQSCHDRDELLILVTPVTAQVRHIQLVIEAGLLWNRPGYVYKSDDCLVGQLGTQCIRAFGTNQHIAITNIDTQTPYLAFDLSAVVGIFTGRNRSLADIQSTIHHRAQQHVSVDKERFGVDYDVYNAIQSSLAWDTIYEPSADRVVTTVSRNWNCSHGGYILFCWDTYFAAHMFSSHNKHLAYANAIEMTLERTEEGFVPNFADGLMKSLDRSQPPLGAWTVLQLFKQHKDLWLLELLFDDLLAWNRWWPANRDNEGLLCWGSTPYEPTVNSHWETTGVNDTLGGALESGLDNSPMYDNVPFDSIRHCMLLADVGLNSLYVLDCDALGEIARILGRSLEANDLKARADHYRNALATLWSDDVGLFLNKSTDTGEFSHRISPTNFYPLICKAATQQQANRMIEEHFNNPDEFWGDWMLPSIARNDPAYPEQDYWRGRIWAPLNFLVYLGFRNYDLPKARQDLAERSRNLLLKEWHENGHVHENYSADTGDGCDKGNSDRFYHWGGLLGTIALMESDNTRAFRQ